MADNDFNTIRPVENLPNVSHLTPTGQPQERKRRQNPPRRDQGTRAALPGTTEEEQAQEHPDDSHTIDYRA
jgi:hypothetical protein